MYAINYRSSVSSRLGVGYFLLARLGGSTSRQVMVAANARSCSVLMPRNNLEPRSRTSSTDAAFVAYCDRLLGTFAARACYASGPGCPHCSSKNSICARIAIVPGRLAARLAMHEPHRSPLGLPFIISH